MKRKQIALGLLILAAAALRFYRLSAQDIWGDEAFSIFLSQQPLGVVVAGASDTHPPLYPLLLFFWLQLVGASAFATRALSALIGILAVPLTFVFARRLIARPRVAWLAALMAAVSPLLIYYSQETRMYELVAVLSLCPAYFFLTLFPAASQKNLGRRAAYFLTTLLAMYTHYSAFFVLAGENAFALVCWFQRRREWGWRWQRDWLLVQTVLVVCYIPWIVVQTAFLSGKASARFDEWGWRGFEAIFGKTLYAFSIGLTLDAPAALWATVLFIALTLVGLVAVARTRRAVAWFAPLYFALPIIIAYALNPVMPFFFERYVLVALPGFIVTVALGLDWLAERRRIAALGALGILLLANIFSLGNYYFNDAYAKGKYGQMMAYVAANAQPGDALVLNNPLQKPLYRYYAPRDVPAYFLPDGVPLEDPASRRRLEEVARQHSRLWLVMFGNPAEYDPTGYLERWLGTNAFKTFARGFVDAGLSLYTMPSAKPAVTRQLGATLGENIRLLGYDLDRTQVVPGQTVQVVLHWQVAKPIDARYKVFAHLIGGVNPATGSPIWAQMDSEPVGGTRPTTTWLVGETIDDRYGLLIPADTPPGEYLIEVGMYEPTSLERLPVRDANGARVQGERVLLDPVRVGAR